MDYVSIAHTAGPETAQIMQDSDYIDTCINERARTVDAQQLDDLTRGALILGAEPVDYPLTDGLIIYLQKPAGGITALLIETETAADPEAEERANYIDVLRISKAKIA